jgi:dihydroxyacetone kinase-like predicted kinase
VLKAAGVVDAGGRGLVVVLDALVAALSGRLDPPEPAPVAVDQVSAVAAAFEPLAETLGEPPLFEVQYLVAAEQPAAGAAESLRADLDSVADSVVVVDNGNGLLAVHAHTGDVGAVLERGLSRGRASRITVERITEFVAAERAGELPRPAVGRRAVVAASAGTARLPVGLARVLEKEGVRLAEASTSRSEAVVEAALTAAADEVVLLFDVRDAREVVDPAAERLRARGIRVAAVPTRSPVQALAAVAVHDGARPFDDDVVAMAEAAAATRVAELTVARQDALTSAGPCRPGDVLGMIDGEVVEVGRGLLAVALALADRLLGVGVELMTVVVAADVGAGVAETVRRHVRDRSPFTEVTVYDVASPGPGVQSFPDDELYGEIPLILGAE